MTETTPSAVRRLDSPAAAALADLAAMYDDLGTVLRRSGCSPSSPVPGRVIGPLWTPQPRPRLAPLPMVGLPLVLGLPMVPLEWRTR